MSKNQILTSIKGRNSVANLRKTKIYNTNLDLVTDNVYINFGLILSIHSQDIEQNQILTSIKGRNSVANLRKTTIYNTKVDLVSDNVYTKFGLNRSICFQDIEQNSILTSIKGSNSVANLPKFELIQAFMHVLLTCKNEVDQIKHEGAQVFTRFLPLQVYGGFSRRSRAANSAVLGLIWPNFELVRDLMDVLITCKYEEDLIKNEGARVVTTLYINISDAQGQITLVLVVVSG